MYDLYIKSVHLKQEEKCTGKGGWPVAPVERQRNVCWSVITHNVATSIGLLTMSPLPLSPVETAVKTNTNVLEKILR